MLQAPVFDGLSFDPFPFQQDGLAAPEVDIGGREVIQALVVAPVVVVLDEGAELGFEITGQIIVLQQDPVLGLTGTFYTSGNEREPLERKESDMTKKRHNP